MPVVYPMISPEADPKNFNEFWGPWEKLTDRSEYYVSKKICKRVLLKQVKNGLHPSHYYRTGWHVMTSYTRYATEFHHVIRIRETLMSRTKGFSVLKKCIYKAYFTKTALVIPQNPHRRRQTSWLFKMVMKLMVRAKLQSSGHVALFKDIEGCGPNPTSSKSARFESHRKTN